MTSFLKYPLELKEDQVDYVTFESFEYRTNSAITGQGQGFTGGANAGPPSGGKKIVLYMPPTTPAVNQSNDWGAKTFDGPLGQLAKAGAVTVANEAMNADLSSYDAAKQSGTNAINSLTKLFEEGMSKAGGAARQLGVNMVAGAAQLEPNQLLAMSRGEIFNPNVELLYSGPKVRGFGMSFTFVPKNQAEATVINNIIPEFKKWSSPSTENAGNGMYGSYGLVNYMTGNDYNRNMNAFKRAALTDIAVQSNPGLDMHMTFDNGMPVVTSISLTFTEVDVITREDHLEANSNIGY